jgi:hypothetical protein
MMVGVIIMHNAIDGEVTVYNAFTQVHHNSAGLRVDFRHQRNLMALLRKIGLVDAQSINPQGSRLVFAP